MKIYSLENNTKNIGTSTDRDSNERRGDHLQSSEYAR